MEIRRASLQYRLGGLEAVSEAQNGRVLPEVEGANLISRARGFST